MRTNRIREGLLADPMTPGATTDLRPISNPSPGEWRTQSPVNQTIGDLGFRSEMQQFTQHERDPKWDAIRSELGLGPAAPRPQITPDMVAQARVGAAIQGSGGRPQMPPTNPSMQRVLPELSDLAQGKAMGRPMAPADIPPPPSLPGPIPPSDDSADLPTRPTGPAPNGGEPDGEEMFKKSQQVDESADLPSRPPLQNMAPVDPSYGDLFKKLRPYQ